jgi:hypothetical protein
MVPARRHAPAPSVITALGAALAVVAISAQAPPVDPTTALLDRATAYVVGYVRALSSVVSEERYQQVVRSQGFARSIPGSGMSGSLSGSSSMTRTLVSDYLLVLVPGASEWIPFRDVYSVDGAAVRDRSNRLLFLFVEAQAHAIQQAERIRAESSRYNIGNVTRDINVPTFALQYLLPECRGRSVFRVTGTERIGSVETTVVEFEERSTPTLVVGRDNENVPGRGRFWLEPRSGLVLQTLLETRPPGMTTKIITTYQYEAKLGLWVPARMDEKHNLGSESVEGLATYTNFRQFQVETTVDVKK